MKRKTMRELVQWAFDDPDSEILGEDWNAAAELALREEGSEAPVMVPFMDPPIPSTRRLAECVTELVTTLAEIADSVHDVSRGTIEDMAREAIAKVKGGRP